MYPLDAGERATAAGDEADAAQDGMAVTTRDEPSLVTTRPESGSASRAPGATASSSRPRAAGS